MSLGAYESSRFSGEPINLYFFQYGVNPNDHIAYTDAEDPKTFNGVNYQPIAIDRGKISSSGSLDKANLTITTPHDSQLADLFLIYPPSHVTTLIMYQGHASDSDQDYKAVWTGRVLSCSRKGSQANFTCEPIATSMRRNGLRRRYQYGCPHVLYGEDCRANKDAATVTAIVEGVAGARITLQAGWAGQYRAAKYVQGLAQWQTPANARETRTVLRADSDGHTFLLSGSLRDIGPGSEVDMVLGCNHKSGSSAQPDGDCLPLHDNILNFGGQEFIPFKNPIGSLSNSFY